MPFDAQDNVFLLAGPVKIHPRVLQAMTHPSINHRGGEFKAVVRELRELLQYAFQTSGEVAILSGAGTAGLESAVSSILHRSDKVLNLVNGKFSERVAELCAIHTTEPKALRFDWGRAVDPQAVAAELDAAPYTAVTVCHNETSTGVTNPLREIAAACRKKDVLLLADGITSVAGLETRMEWGVDALVTGSQKCLAAPAGVAAVAVSARAYERLHPNQAYYLDLKRHIDAMRDKGETPFTPAIPLFFALREALRMLKEEGLETRLQRTARLAEACRAAAAAIDIDLFPDARHASNTVTALRYPPNVPDEKFRTVLREDHRTIVSGGQDAIKGKVFRLGHMGLCSFADIAAGWTGIEATLAGFGHAFPRGAAVAEIARRA
jgi:aspartate aminotransferase-like enzyme